LKRLSHIGSDGKVQMVDVSAKPQTLRLAIATGKMRIDRLTAAAISQNKIAKGNVLATAQIAGIQAAKRTAELIPLCHPLPLSDIKVDLMLDPSLPGVRCESEVRTTARTGVEMEALTAVAVTLLTIYDMAKSLDKTMQITQIELLEKAGGRSGHWRRIGDST